MTRKARFVRKDERSIHLEQAGKRRIVEVRLYYLTAGSLVLPGAAGLANATGYFIVVLIQLGFQFFEQSEFFGFLGIERDRHIPDAVRDVWCEIDERHRHSGWRSIRLLLKFRP